MIVSDWKAWRLGAKQSGWRVAKPREGLALKMMVCPPGTVAD
jgi:hypothetical protein